MNANLCHGIFLCIVTVYVGLVQYKKALFLGREPKGLDQGKEFKKRKLNDNHPTHYAKKPSTLSLGDSE